MKLEKAFYVSGDRVAKIVVHGRLSRNGREMTIDFDFFIKEKNDIDFRPPIGENHPQYWKLKNSDSNRSQLLQLEYSGISRKQLREAIRAFKLQAGPGVIFRYENALEQKTKYLRGMRAQV